MLKILPAGLQQYVNYDPPDVQAGFRKGRGTRDQVANNRWIIEKARKFQKKTYICFINYAKPLTAWITTNWKIIREGNTRLPYLLPEKSVCRSGGNS